VFRLLYTTPTVENALCDRAFAQACADVIHALLRAQEDAGVVPSGEAAKFAQHLPPQFDLATAERTGLRGNPVSGLVEQFYAITPYALLGITSNDLWDMAHVLQLRAAISSIFDDVRALVESLAGLAEAHAETRLPARTHGRAGPPTTFGFKVAGWLDELLRNAARLQSATRSAALVSIAGSAGTASSFAVLGIDPGEVERRLAEALDLQTARTPWVTARDRSVDLAEALSALATLLGKIGHDVVNLERTGIGELDETGGFGSMATPHKESNPWTPARMHGLGAIARALAATVAQAAALPEGEREIGTAYAEWYGLSQLCRITGRACADAVDLFGRIVVNASVMQANLERDPAVRAESLSMILAKAIGKQRAHELMHEAVRGYRAGEPFGECVRRAFREAGVEAPDFDRALPGELGDAVTRTRDTVARARVWLAG
jgi:3-carboxy-cis,cis-muconate cycloisomerase